MSFSKLLNSGKIVGNENFPLNLGVYVFRANLRLLKSSKLLSILDTHTNSKISNYIRTITHLATITHTWRSQEGSWYEGCKFDCRSTKE